MTAGAGGAVAAIGTPHNGANITFTAGAGGNGASSSNNGAGGGISLISGAAGTGGSGNTANVGTITMSPGGTAAITLGGAGLGIGLTALSLTVTTANVTLTAIQASNPAIATTGTLTGSRTIIFPAVAAGQMWILDTTGTTFSSHTISVEINSNTASTTISAAAVWLLYYNGTKFYAFTTTTD
jgi:hypothetical protein